MTSPPDRKLTARRRAFLEAALANENLIERISASYFRQSKWRAGGIELREVHGEFLLHAGLIERVRSAPSFSAPTERLSNGHRHYRVTGAGRAALNRTSSPAA